MTTQYEIPLTPNAQTFTISLNNVTYTMTLVWNGQNNTWVLDIADANGNGILSGITIVANNDLLSPYPYLNFEGQLIAETDVDLTTPPVYDNLGTTGHIYFVTTP